ERWDDYVRAYEECLEATSTKWAPWYVIPADRKWVTRAAVGVILTETIKRLDLAWPKVTDEQKRAIAEAKKQLEKEAKGYRRHTCPMLQFILFVAISLGLHFLLKLA